MNNTKKQYSLNTLNKIYNKYLQRDIDCHGKKYLKKLNDGMKLEELINIIKNSKEYKNINKNKIIFYNFLKKINIITNTSVLNKSSYNCLIIEPRNHEFLEKIMINFAFKLGNQFTMQLLHGNKNKELANNIKNKIKNLNLVNLNIDNLTIKEYSRLLKKDIFWENIKGDKVLIFQTDTYLFKEIPEKFLQYDYIGAPWEKENIDSKTFVGNGGLSIRNKKIIIDICKKYGNNDIDLSEDVFFSKYCKICKYNLASKNVAKEFSVENVYYHNPIGIHKPINLNSNILMKLLSKNT